LATSVTLAAQTAGAHTIYVRAKDLAGNVDQEPASRTFMVNVAPVVHAPEDQTVDEGTSKIFGLGTFSDSHGSPWSVDVDWGDGTAHGNITNVMSAGDVGSLAHTYADGPAERTVTVTVSDSMGLHGAATFKVTVRNVAPTITLFEAPLSPVPLSTAVVSSLKFTDPGVLDYHDVLWSWEDGTSTPKRVDPQAGERSTSASHTYTVAGVYNVSVTVTDKDGASDARTLSTWVVIYDPSGGFVTGGGWINSPAGAYRWDTSLTGKATFGFVSKYLKGANVPTGNTEFQFHAGKMNFSSTAYDWLVVAGSKAMYKGVGTINGGGKYGFMLSAIDNGSSGDTFRIKIWDYASGNLVYDNQLGAVDDANPTMGIEGGSIVVHASNKK
jgi:hypothetical protein